VRRRKRAEKKVAQFKCQILKIDYSGEGETSSSHQFHLPTQMDYFCAFLFISIASRKIFFGEEYPAGVTHFEAAHQSGDGLKIGKKSETDGGSIFN
jgi:hypothetical protein